MHICILSLESMYGMCIVRNQISIRLQSRNSILGKQIALRHNNNNNSNVFI